MRYMTVMTWAGLAIGFASGLPAVAQQTHTGAPAAPLANRPENGGTTTQSGVGSATQGGMNALSQSGSGSSGANMGTGMGPGVSSPASNTGAAQPPPNGSAGTAGGANAGKPAAH